MTKHKSLRLLANALPFLLFGITAACQPPAAVDTQRSDSSQIERVEYGLLPAISIAGLSNPPPLKLSDRMAHYRVPGVSVAIINNGELEWAKGYGTLTAHNSRPVTSTTLFQAASISKPVTAMAALTLVQSGKLQLDENINATLKSWRVPDNEFTSASKVTLRQLLSHTAGFNVDDVGSYAAGEPLPTLLQALDGREPARSVPIRVEQVPGKQFRYSGGGYSVIQQAVIDATGEPFADAMQDLVLGRLGMMASTFRQPLPDGMQSMAATGHDVAGEPLKGRWYSFPQAAAAGLWTTPSDLARFAMELQRSFNAASNTVLSAEMTKQMMTPQMNGYGLGVWLGGKDKSANFSHPGKNEGFMCILFAYLETGQGAVVMTNGDGGNGLFNEILRAIAAEYRWPDYRQREKAVVATDARSHASYIGEYEISGIRVTISTSGDHLFVQAPPVWPQRARLYPSGDNKFFMTDEDVDLTFVRDERGQVVEMRALASGQNVVAKKVK